MPWFERRLRCRQQILGEAAGAVAGYDDEFAVLRRSDIHFPVIVEIRHAERKPAGADIV
jgi:hypothetical protein